MPALSPTHVDLETYGDTEDRERFPLESTTSGYEFSIDSGPVKITGVMTSRDATGAVINLTEASYEGVNTCDTGTYTLPPEE